MEVILGLFAVESVLDLVGPFAHDIWTDSEDLYSCQESGTGDGLVLINDGLQ